jgi:hypothetical protein
MPLPELSRKPIAHEAAVVVAASASGSVTGKAHCWQYSGLRRARDPRCTEQDSFSMLLLDVKLHDVPVKAALSRYHRRSGFITCPPAPLTCTLAGTVISVASRAQDCRPQWRGVRHRPRKQGISCYSGTPTHSLHATECAATHQVVPSMLHNNCHPVWHAARHMHMHSSLFLHAQGYRRCRRPTAASAGAIVPVAHSAGGCSGPGVDQYSLVLPDPVSSQDPTSMQAKVSIPGYIVLTRQPATARHACTADLVRSIEPCMLAPQDPFILH